jgi:hypothetical protein
MPRLTPTHNPQFTEEQLASAREVAARSSAPFREVIRARLTLLLAGDPSLSHRKLALRAGLSMQAVRKWRHRWARQGWSLTDAPRSGRPAAFPPSRRGGREGGSL